MKKVIVYGAVAVGAYLLFKKLNKPAGVGDDLMLPPSGKTVTASGQIVGGLGYLNRNIDAYDAAPYQYRSEPANDFLPGMQGLGDLGFSIGKAFKSVGNAVTNVVKVVSHDVSKVGQGIGKGLKVAGMTVGIVKKPSTGGGGGSATVYQDANGNTISKAEYDAQMAAAQAAAPKFAETYKGFSIWTMLKNPPVAQVAAPASPPPVNTPVPRPSPSVAPAPQPVGPTITIQDKIKAGGAPYYGNAIIRDGKVGVMSRGNFIAFHGLGGFRHRGLRGLGDDTDGVVYLVNYVEATSTVDGIFNTMAEAKAAIDAVTAPVVAPPAPAVPTVTASTLTPVNTYNPPPPAVSTSVYTPPPPAVNTPVYTPPAMSTYDATKAAAEEASMRTSDDSGDYGPPPTQTTTPLPENVTSVQTPSATVLPAFTPPPAASSFTPPPAAAATNKSNAGLLVGGGILAALAAVVMNK